MLEKETKISNENEMSTLQPVFSL